ncbi:hypothetical protein POF50_025620 [Streptomyces sp. SL13]|jgi:hypothetical protein|uniref:Uncharacterized protein n=1 Tax=Streptantibioticus silvisoli TaxID=2705255 RepID=A0AA90H694_9ACTN|nr:hypothetical protein [Streptantibioticus silvisoli]MDI5972681.1 hypothetical protein [Streptantibioticus silvisoli]
MTEPLGIAGTVLGLLGKVKGLFEGSDKKTLVTSMLTAVLTVAVIAAGYLVVGHHATPGSQEVKLGGLDLGGYCASYSYDDNDEDFCSSAIDLDKACSWQWSTPLRAKGTGIDSTQCYSSSGKRRGGIKDMTGYCEATFKGSADVEASSVGNKWVCRTKIDKAAACDWQYQKNDPLAREEGGLWYCYARAKA